MRAFILLMLGIVGAASVVVYRSAQKKIAELSDPIANAAKIVLDQIEARVIYQEETQKLEKNKAITRDEKNRLSSDSLYLIRQHVKASGQLHEFDYEHKRKIEREKLTSRIALCGSVLSIALLGFALFAFSFSKDKRGQLHQAPEVSEREVFNRLFRRRRTVWLFQFTILELFAAAVAVQVIIAAVAMTR